ncbi:MAG: hypothetical protein ACI8QZ_000780 [Chlamydiales bacterium]|jgi:hypothetical protein
MRYLSIRGLILASGLLAATGSAAAQSGFGPRVPVQPNQARAFLEPYGLSNFSLFYRRALNVWINAGDSHAASDDSGAQQTLDALWQVHPTGGIGWGNLPTKPFGINIGSPPCYYGLRMLSDLVEWRVQSGVQGNVAPRTVRMTVLLLGESNGIEPRNLAELNQGTGIHVTHALDPRLERNDNAIVHGSLALFEEYIFAMTDGQLAVDIQVASLPDLNLPVHAFVSQGRYIASLENPADVWATLPDEVLQATDWWWLIYPSHVPEQYPDFTNAEFVTGGMGTGYAGGSPLFLIDDRWLVRKPPHIGTGEYTGLERRAYLPQWLQHEFFHHLFRTYPEFNLEQTPHQWFDRSTWPADFVGRYEADYFHEALFKRLQTATPPLHVALRYATADAPWGDLVLADVLGTFRREPVQNPWHIGNITQVSGNQLLWTNNAGVSWQLQADLLDGKLLTGPDCPYYDPPNGTKFDIALERDSIGDLTDQVRGFIFNGELYALQ